MKFNSIFIHNEIAKNQLEELLDKLIKVDEYEKASLVSYLIKHKIYDKEYDDNINQEIEKLKSDTDEVINVIQETNESTNESMLLNGKLSSYESEELDKVCELAQDYLEGLKEIYSGFLKNKLKILEEKSIPDIKDAKLKEFYLSCRDKVKSKIEKQLEEYGEEE